MKKLACLSTSFVALPACANQTAALAEIQQQQKAMQVGGFPTNLFQNTELPNAEDVKKIMSCSCVLTQNWLLSLQRKLSELG